MLHGAHIPKSFFLVFEEYAKANPQECLSVVIDDKPDLCDKYAIEYYPTVLLLKKGKFTKDLMLRLERD